jgi:hypothetical protein
MVKSTLSTLRQRLKVVVNSHPRLYFPLVRLRNYKNQRSVMFTRHTEIVIEGYPRSGNTFAVAAFLFAQGREVQIARHLHAPAQVIAAIKAGVPAIVLIRKPADAVISMVIRHPQLSLTQALCEYLAFYEPLYPVRHTYVLATFEEVTHHFDNVIKRVNQLYQRTFNPFEHTPENVEKVFALVEDMDKENTGQAQISEDKVARPSDERKRRKDLLLENLGASDVKDILQRAEHLYQRFMETLT